MGTLGRRFIGFDTLAYLAVVTSKKVYRFNRKKNDIVRVVRQRVAGVTKDAADDANNEKIKIFSALSVQNRNKIILEDILGKYKEQNKVTPVPSSKKHHNDSMTVSNHRRMNFEVNRERNLTLASLDLDEYTRRYADVFQNKPVKKKNTKTSLQRMKTIDVNSPPIQDLMDVS